MTWALCFACGEIKFGAICPCPACSVATSGDMTLDILFSDHYLAKETLEQFGHIVRAIQEEAGDPQFGFYAFLYHVSRNYPDLLQYETSPQGAQQIAALLAPLDLPRVDVMPGRTAASDGESEQGAEPRPGPQRRPWWQKWRRGGGP